MVTILLVLVFVLLTLGLMLHGVYLESKIDMPCRPSNQHDRMSDSGMARFFGRKGRSRI
jgi:hypothetical protein